MDDFAPDLSPDDITPTGAIRRALWACAIGGLGAIIIACLITYSSFDSTADTAGLNTNIHNFLGRPGANFANFLLQFLGWSALPLGGLMMFAAARAVLKPRLHITRWDTFYRSNLLVFSVFFLAVFLSAFPIPQSWPMATGLGGWVGDVVFAGLKSLFTAVHVNAAIAGGTVAFLSFCAFGYCLGRFLGLVGRDVALIVDAAGLLWATARVRLDQFISFLRKKFQKS
ncbi:MAG TPA: hypothetical protein ENJ46_00170, partial [Hellea balneolensis]|nr:hypothetical protein [Hellea balneolensis]